VAYQGLLKYGLQWIAAILLGAVTAVSSAAEPDEGVKVSQAGKPAATRSSIIYKPPLQDAPLPKVGGSTRGTGGDTAILQALVPEHAGLTTQVQPTLY